MSAERAAIRRATLAAHRAVESLDAAGRAELARAYRSAAADLRQLIAQYAGPDDAVRLAQLRDLLRQVEARLLSLGELRTEILHEGMRKAGDYGARVFAVDGSAAMRVSGEALRMVQGTVAADGMQLSDRIWRIDRQARDQVVNAIERAVIEGQSAIEASREFLARGEPLPADLARKMGAPASGRIGNEAAQALTGRGSAMDNAQRLFRTEINRAHGEAYMLGGEGSPGFVGWRYLLSPAHPEPDICDLYAAQNLYGLGPGVYPSRAKTPWPAHPNTLSFVEIVFDDEVGEAEREGKETPMQALARLDAETRRGVLGKNKAEAFDAGLLTQGMIRAPWAAVQARLERTASR